MQLLMQSFAQAFLLQPSSLNNDNRQRRKKTQNWISTNCAEQVGDNWDTKEKIFRNTINAFTSDSTLQVGLIHNHDFYDIINEYNSTSRSPNPGQVRSNAKFYSPSFYRKYENNIQVLASFGQTASTTKLVQVNWEQLKHLKSCLFV